jgi:hypothetical protein
MMLTLRIIQFCNANNKQVIILTVLLVQLGINSTRDVWTDFAKLGSPRRFVQFWQNLQTSLVNNLYNCARHRMITYPNNNK